MAGGLWYGMEYTDTIGYSVLYNPRYVPFHPKAAARRIWRKPEEASWRSHIHWLKDFRRFREEIYSCPLSYESEGWCTAIVLGYKRPQNIDLIVRALLQTPAVGKVIVSNNNPSYNLRKWISVQNPRVRLLNPMDQRGTIERFRIASNDSAEFFLAVDDDIFLRPEQFQIVCEALKRESEVPHGIFGELHEGGNVRHAVHNYSGPFDVINRVYAFTVEHVHEFFRLVEELGLKDRSTWHRCYWDDMVLSFSGLAKPQGHDVGEYLDCTTQGKRGVAAWREESFMEGRKPIYKSLETLKPRKEETPKSRVHTQTPSVSVVMSVYNGMPDLEEAVESILTQTFDDFEFIVTDDASIDETSSTLLKFAERDSRIVLLRNTENCGQLASSNKGILHAQAPYIARMDADDISLPARLEKCVQYLRNHPETELVSTNWEWYSIPKGKSLGPSNLSYKPHLIAWHLLFFNYLACQSAVMFRRKTVERLGCYSEIVSYAEDYDLWVRLMKEGDLAVIPEELVQFRRGRKGSMSVELHDSQAEHAQRIALRTLKEFTGREYTSDELNIMQSVLPIFWRHDSPSSESIRKAKVLLTGLQPAFVHWWSKSRLCDVQLVNRDICRCIPEV